MSILNPSETTLNQAISCLLTTQQTPMMFDPGAVFSRLHDDTDGQTDPEHWLTVTPLSDSHIEVTVGLMKVMNFYTGAGLATSPQTVRALWVLAEAIRRDNMAQHGGLHASPALKTGQDVNSDVFVAALNVVLEMAFFIPTLHLEKVYRRMDDGQAHEPGEGELMVYISGDCDVHLLGSSPSLRFRDYFGGGRSLRVRNALLLVAEAMRRDDEAEKAI